MIGVAWVLVLLLLVYLFASTMVLGFITAREFGLWNPIMGLISVVSLILLIKAWSASPCQDILVGIVGAVI